MSRVRTLEVSHSYFGPLALQELLVDRNRGRQPGDCKDGDRMTGTDRLCNTIEVLGAAPFYDETDGIAQAILSNCPRLRSLQASKITVTEIVHGAQWVCSRIENLRLYFNMDLDPESEEGMMNQRLVFKRLGELTGLQELALADHYSTRTLDLRLRAGLNELANLKSLTTLSFSYDICQAIGPEEARWIVKNWTRIKHLDGVLNNDPDIVELIASIFRLHGIQHYRERRIIRRQVCII
ncbi:hypothetical protein BCR41DRAFT_344209 [Lobosporangium transversale]|uniref:F-box domain-containing protein n=1 Tax=Lobosporangium transversale TaxID=64571 RepID=A0A1Y2H2U0_9FUNG|nr:hypothetical protein BCR41DRAFT_344209 [Lobosporangium transversale]ORZ28868.1 hypothetical protein BCR41DRAFT_344209 [Lobosporangium transversale]|eukprot:XP_021886541.1 hypothetical protein BCR41DRAFT_344209 [Lobosporangium transversale]